MKNSDWGFDEFEAERGREFQLHLEAGTVAATLAETRRLAHGAREGGSFTLVFEVGEAHQNLSQGTYRISRGDYEQQMFLVPVGPFANGFGLEAVFS